MGTKIKMAVVGAGMWGEKHAQLYAAHPLTELVGICDKNPEKSAKVAHKFKVPQHYDSFQEMFEKSGCDAVSIATPDFTHADIVIKAAEYKKDILVESPLATTREDIYHIMDVVEKTKIRLTVTLHNRWVMPFRAARQSVKDGELGEIYSIYMRLNGLKKINTDLLPWTAKSSALWFLGTHSLDTIHWFFDDEVSRVYSVSQSGVLKGFGADTVDEYQTTIEFKRGGIAQMENAWMTPHAIPCVNDVKFSALGTKGVLNIDTSQHHLIQKFTEEKTDAPAVLMQDKLFAYPSGYAFESIRSFVNCLLSGEKFLITADNAMKNNLTILSIMESAEKRMPVDVKF